MTSLTYWPYDEVMLKQGRQDSEVLIETPWLQTTVRVAEAEIERCRSLTTLFEQGGLAPEYLAELNWFFKALSEYPLCYVLPRAIWAGELTDYVIKDSSLLTLAPNEFLKAALGGSHQGASVDAVAREALFEGEWKWDAEGAVAFSSSALGVDPCALFSVARRYHLLNSVENDRTEALYAFVRELKQDERKFHKASALMVRQNHYVTQRCNPSLVPALATAREAKEFVQEFIQAELGHDRIIAAALKAMGDDPEKIPVTDAVKVLMELLQFSGERNFLAFAMVVDFFERSSYQDSDPLAKVLSEGGFASAARHLNRHMDINDAGDHENIAFTFLSKMGPVGRDYAVEALRIAEVTTNVMNLVSSGVLRVLKTTPYLDA